MKSTSKNLGNGRGTADGQKAATQASGQKTVLTWSTLAPALGPLWQTIGDTTALEPVAWLQRTLARGDAAGCPARFLVGPDRILERSWEPAQVLAALIPAPPTSPPERYLEIVSTAFTYHCQADHTVTASDLGPKGLRAMLSVLLDGFVVVRDQEAVRKRPPRTGSILTEPFGRDSGMANRGPFWALLNETRLSEGPAPRRAHVAYLVPDLAARAYLVSALDFCCRMAILDAATAESMVSKLYTHEDYAQMQGLCASRIRAAAVARDATARRKEVGLDGGFYVRAPPTRP